MKYAAYQYTTRVTFSKPVISHFFLLRCTPSHNACQQVLRETCAVTPASNGSLCRGADSFGNIVHSGGIAELHGSFEIETSGEVKLADSYLLPEERPNRLYAYPSLYTTADAGIVRLWQKSGGDAGGVEMASAGALEAEKNGAEIANAGKSGAGKRTGRAAVGNALGSDSRLITDTVVRLSDVVHGALEYAPNTTDITTTAAQALALGRGVCQDFSHLLISLVRLSGIPVRYAAGFIEGEGQTHAWVEFYENGCWKAVDPTHNRLVDTGYIKLSHGRDYEDCSIERGVFIGVAGGSPAGQTLDVSLSVGMREFF